MISEQQFGQFQTPFPILYTKQISNSPTRFCEIRTGLLLKNFDLYMVNYKTKILTVSFNNF